MLFENLFNPRQRRLAVYMLLTSSVLSTTSKQCFELTSSVSSTTSKPCFEQPVASFLVCSLIFIEYKQIRKSPVPQDEEQGSFCLLFFCAKAVFSNKCCKNTTNDWSKDENPNLLKGRTTYQDSWCQATSWVY